jgi:hypothetical protein
MNWLLMICSFAFFWCFGFLIHEVGHWLGAVLTGGSAKIKFWLYKGFIPSMKTHPSGDYNRLIFLYAGGFFTYLIYFIGIVLTNNYYIEYPLFVVGLTNIMYASYEINFIDEWNIDKYMKWHYVLYLICFIGFTGIYYVTTIA